jgi:hypothetical protein
VRNPVLRALLFLAIPAWAVFPTAAAAAADPGDGPVVALLPVQDRAGDRPAVVAVDQALREELEGFSRVVDAVGTRDALRRQRMRNGNLAPPEALRRLAEELEAEWLITVTLHEAWRRNVPCLTLSAHAYHGADGELAWTGFRGGSGLDGRTVLGLGRIETLEQLALPVVKRLTAELAGVLTAGEAGPRESGGGTLGRLGIVPFAGLTARDATTHAETVTEAARAAAHRIGVRTVSPGCTNEVLRRQTLVGWGGIDADTRSALRERCGAETILTGSVERYEVGGAQDEPEPRASIAMRLIDSGTGRIVWTGAEERDGWDRQGLFRLGRVHSRGELTARMMDSLARRLLREYRTSSEGEERKR